MVSCNADNDSGFAGSLSATVRFRVPLLAMPLGVGVLNAESSPACRPQRGSWARLSCVTIPVTPVRLVKNGPDWVPVVTDPSGNCVWNVVLELGLRTVYTVVRSSDVLLSTA